MGRILSAERQLRSGSLVEEVVGELLGDHGAHLEGASSHHAGGSRRAANCSDELLC